MELPPGFKFHRTDEEIINFYVVPKVQDENFAAVVIQDVHLNKYEPWELPEKANMGRRTGTFTVERTESTPPGYERTG